MIKLRNILPEHVIKPRQMKCIIIYIDGCRTFEPEGVVQEKGSARNNTILIVNNQAEKILDQFKEDEPGETPDYEDLYEFLGASKVDDGFYSIQTYEESAVFVLDPSSEVYDKAVQVLEGDWEGAFGELHEYEMNYHDYEGYGPLNINELP